MLCFCICPSRLAKPYSFLKMSHCQSLFNLCVWFVILFIIRAARSMLAKPATRATIWRNNIRKEMALKRIVMDRTYIVAMSLDILGLHMFALEREFSTHSLILACSFFGCDSNCLACSCSIAVVMFT